MENLKYEIGNRIAETRKRKSFTQEILAEKVDISTKHLSAVERGKSTLSLEKLIKLCSILDVSVDFVLTGKSFNPSEIPLPKSAMDVFLSEDTSEIELFLEYISLYDKLRNKK